MSEFKVSSFQCTKWHHDYSTRFWCCFTGAIFMFLNQWQPQWIPYKQTAACIDSVGNRLFIYLFILYHKLPENSWLVFWVLLRLKAVTLELVLVAFRSKCNLKTTGCLLTVNKTWCILELFIWKPQLVTFGDLVCLSFVVVVFFLFLLTSCNIRTHVTIFAVIVSVFDTMLLLSRFNCQVSSSWMSSF